MEIDGSAGSEQANESCEYKSKNLHAERRRRQKLTHRLLSLRSTVPIITNMNKATIIDDAITYIKQLQMTVNSLKDQLHFVELDSSSSDDHKFSFSISPLNFNISHFQAVGDVNVIKIDEQKMWVKIQFEKRKGTITKLIDALSSFGFEITDTSLTTFKGTVIITTIINGIFDESTVEQAKDLLVEIVNGF